MLIPALRTADANKRPAANASDLVRRATEPTHS